ncbi:glycosyltransferase [Gemmata sp. JC673]|uniref:Glycosyltransferase n=1 Tax=Gemmata algarum TaxID=2975278 RepID=A0ABU5F7Y5_9BACT|nr:glycosyltransferase family 2 protein [Gemmata algarum]MDY3561974.1 glycosyltransferase [Gemmata algarum]
MTLVGLALGALLCAAAPALLYLWNSVLFREPPALPSGGDAAAADQPVISVLIPARNEELGIEACVRSVLASRHVELEVIVLDDASTDRTADIVRALAVADPRVRVQSAPPLPDGWAGKQHACFALSQLARYDILTFLDADVRLRPDALARMARFLRESKCALVSGFPHQETGTLFERLLIPLINWLLLSFLPLWGMRRSPRAAFGAGCGQWFMTARAAYETVGGHGAVRSSFHDGLTLPRAYRKAGFGTDICDATHLASCRMYRSASAVWFGLAKNAREGMAATGQIGFWTVTLFCGQVVPALLLVLALSGLTFEADPHERTVEQAVRPFALSVLGSAIVMSLSKRCHAAVHFRQSWVGVLLHPVAILLLLAVQWYAVLRWVIGKPVGWKGRALPAAKL